MATTLDTRIRPEVSGVLSRLKSRIRWYVITEGLLMLVFLAAVIFWALVLIDMAYFAIRKFDLAVSFRIGYLTVGAILLVSGFIYWIGLRLFRSMREKPLALVLERRFPNLNDRLVTSVEASESMTGQESELTQSMLNRTIESATAEARNLRVGDVFEKTPLLFSGIASTVGVLSIAALAIFAPGVMDEVIGALILRPEYHERDTRLVVHALLEDSNLGRQHAAGKIAPFVETDDAYTFKHPLGAPLTLLITVPEKDDVGKKLVVPDEVRVYYAQGGEWEDSPLICKPDQQRKRSFKCTFRSLKKDLEFYVIGNDYRSRKPYKVTLETPPAVKTAFLDCDYPAYTGYNRAIEKERDPRYPARVRVGGKKEESLPAETRFFMYIETNKELQSAQIAFGPEDSRTYLKFGWVYDLAPGETADQENVKKKFVATLKWTGFTKTQRMRTVAGLGGGMAGMMGDLANRKSIGFTKKIPRSAAENFFIKDGKSPGFQVPFILSEQKSDAAIQRFFKKYKDIDDNFPGLGGPFHIPPGSEIEISLVDRHGIYNREAGKFVLQAKPDTPPQIEAERRDIGDAITRTATIPLTAFIKDDHGVAQAHIEYRVATGGKKTTEGISWRAWTKIEAPPKRDADGRFPRNYKFTSKTVAKNEKGEEVVVTQPFDYLDASQLKVEVLDEFTKKLYKRDLEPGDLLSVRIYAADADDINGPNKSYSVQDFEFRIVSESELINILTTKEANARVRFEAILREVKRTDSDLQIRRGEIAELRQLRSTKPEAGNEKAHAQKIAEIELRLRDAATISQGQFRKNHNETQEVESLFKQIRAELINNHLQSESGDNIVRLDEIVKLLQVANGPKGQYKQLDDVIDQYVEHCLVPEDGTPPPLNDNQIETDLIETLAKVEQLRRTMELALKKMRALEDIGVLRKKLAKIIDKAAKIKAAIDLRAFQQKFGDN